MKTKKVEKKVAEKELRNYIVSVFDGNFDVKFEMDDGGAHISLYLEVADTFAAIKESIKEKLPIARWRGWRLVTMKVPPGYLSKNNP